MYALRTPRKNSLLDPRVRIRVRQLVGDRTVLLQSCTNKPLRELRVQSGGPSTPRYGSSLTDTTHAEPAASSRTNEPLWELRVQSKAHRRFTLNHLSRMRRTLNRPSPPALTIPCGSYACRAAAHRRLALYHPSRMRHTLSQPRLRTCGHTTGLSRATASASVNAAGSVADARRRLRCRLRCRPRRRPRHRPCPTAAAAGPAAGASPTSDAAHPDHDVQ